MHLPKEVPTDPDNHNDDVGPLFDDQRLEEVAADLEALVLSAAEAELTIEALEKALGDSEADAERRSQFAESLKEARELKQWAHEQLAAAAEMQSQP